MLAFSFYMKLIIAFFLLATISTHASNNAWFWGNTEFDPESCEQTEVSFIKSYDSGFKLSDTERKKMREPYEKCKIQRYQSYMQKFIQFDGKRTIPAKKIVNGISVLEDKDIQSIYDDLRKNPYFPFDVIETQGCFNRANFISAYLSSRGLQPNQVIAHGDLSADRLIGNGRIQWETHTAPYVLNTRGEKIILDPSLTDRPITVTDWVKTMSDKKVKIEFLRTNANEWAKLPDSERDKVFSHLTGSMIRDLFHLLDKSEVLPERITPDLLPYLTEQAKDNYNKMPKLGFVGN